MISMLNHHCSNIHYSLSRGFRIFYHALVCRRSLLSPSLFDRFANRDIIVTIWKTHSFSQCFHSSGPSPVFNDCPQGVRINENTRTSLMKNRAMIFFFLLILTYCLFLFALFSAGVAGFAAPLPPAVFSCCCAAASRSARSNSSLSLRSAYH